MVVIGDRVTTATISTDSPEAYVDYRRDYGALTYELVTPPAEVADGVRRLMTDLGLVYGTLDFVITPDDEWVYLELNPAGQYGWIEDHTGAPLTEHLADLLSGATS